MWYEAKVTLNKGGEDKVYYCNFLCESLLGAQARSVSMAQAEGGKFVHSECKLSEKYNNVGREPTPPETTPALPAPTKVPELSAKEKRAIRAFTVVPINLDVTLYV
jgi:hypothetical protein